MPNRYRECANSDREVAWSIAIVFNRHKAWVVLILSVVGAGCGPGQLFGGAVKPLPQYGKPNLACAGLDLSKSEIDPTSFRKIVRCFNANDSIQPIAKWIDSIKDADLASITQGINRWILARQDRMAQIEHSYQALIDREILEPSLRQFGQVLKNENLVTGTLGLWHQMWSSPLQSELSVALKQVARDFTPEKVSEFLDGAAVLANTPSFEDFRIRIEQTESDTVLPRVYEYFKKGAPIGKELAQTVGSGDFFKAVDQILGSDSGQIKQKIFNQKMFFDFEFGRGATEFDSLASLSHLLNRPLPCLTGAVSVSNALKQGIKQWGEQKSDQAAFLFLRKTVPLTVFWLSPGCTYPAGLTERYSAIERLSQTRALGPASDWIRAVTARESSGFALSTVMHFLSDPPEVVAHLSPLLQEWQKKNLWEILLLTSSAQDQPQRERVERFANWMSLNRPELGKSLIELWVESARNSDFGILKKWVTGLSSLMGLDRDADRQTEVLSSGLKSVRASFYVNNVHPFVDIVADVLTAAPGDPKFIEALLDSSQSPDFLPSLRLVSEMSQDGRLGDVIGSLLALFKNKNRISNAELGAAPALNANYRHTFRYSDLNLGESDSSLESGFEAILGPSCKNLNLNTDWSLLRGKEQQRELEVFFACLNHDDSLGEVESAGTWLLKNSGFSGFSEFFRGFANRIGTVELRKFLSRMIESVDSGGLFGVSRVIPFWTHSESGLTGPLLTWVAPLVQARGPRERVQSQLAGFFENSNWNSIFLGWDEGISASPPPLEVDSKRIARWVANRECVDVLEAQRRTQSLVTHFYDDQNGWDWNSAHLKASSALALLEPVLDKVSDPRQSKAELPLSQGIANALNGFSKDPRVFSSWVVDRAKDLRLITYFFPGETRPRVRLVSALDRLELILVNADLNSFFGKNYGLQFVQQIGESWGDEPRTRWPRPIQERFPVGTRPNTLGQTFEEILKFQESMEKTAGYPPRPSCVQIPAPEGEGELPVIQDDQSVAVTPGVGQYLASFEDKARLFNLRQLIPVVAENLPGVPGPFAGGMKVLRDLFYAIHSTTPGQHQTPFAADKNNLSIIIRLVKLGVMRQATRAVWSGAALNEPLNAAVRLASAARAAEWVSTLSQKGALRVRIRQAIQGALSGEISDGAQISLILDRVAIYFKKNPEAVNPAMNLLADLTLLFAAVDSVPQAHAGIEAFVRRVEALQRDPDYVSAFEVWKRLKFSNLETSNLFHSAMGEPQLMAQIPVSVRQFFAEWLRSEGPQKFLEFMARDPKGFELFLANLGRTVERGQWEVFVRQFRSAVTTP